MWSAQKSGLLAQLVSAGFSARMNPSDWRLQQETLFRGSPRSACSLELSTPVMINEGDTHAFYVHAAGDGGGTKLTCGTQRSNVGDDAIVVHSGQCGRPQRWGSFGTMYSYELAGAVDYR